ncbi:MAG: hypothetical protein L0Z50_14580 [Verrucomicrobiales bacterium]|nr:hypothetical protein [Verrucomicrobiales bacterium]
MKTNVGMLVLSVIYVNPALNKGEVAAYLNWIRSDDGQKAVEDAGYYPLPRPMAR